MVLEKLYKEVSNLLTETNFEERYKYATSEQHDVLVIDTHPKRREINEFQCRFNTWNLKNLSAFFDVQLLNLLD
jgi:hypothetical protein